MITFSKTSSASEHVIFLTEDQIKKVQTLKIPSEIQKHINLLLMSKKFSASLHEIFPMATQKNLYLFVGLGKQKELTLPILRIAVRQLMLSTYLKKAKNINCIVHDNSDESIRSYVEGIELGSYQWKKYISESSKLEKKKVNINVVPKKIYREFVVVCEGVNFARDLVNDNADTVTSIFIEQVIKSLIKGKKNISLEILNEKDLKKKGLHLHLAVNKGSKYPPKLIIVRYKGDPKSKDYTALVGKGITFDTGGLNLKPTGYMETMRTDMGGAAAVVGTLKNVVSLNLKKNLLFVCAMAENAIGSGAYKPGDVFKSYLGKTVEIGNTDAEGRLVLADALGYVSKNYKPKYIIDLATLTGACVVALGYDYTGLISNDDQLANQILKSAEKTDDRAWRLPSYPELKDHLKSQYADLKSTGLPKGAAGTCSAAEFLRQFVGDAKWAHLDIAGTSFVEGSAR
ncbi:MAG: leucyl aminopeptidase, partial [Candidatus Omnitrophica bacterium]|nr:leucyl aminopeptidase [Candidatus Omnitrophota bacterium]